MEKKRKTTFRLRRSHPFCFLAVNKRVNFFIIGRGNHPPVSTRGKSGKSRQEEESLHCRTEGRKEGKVAMRKVIYNLQRRKKRRGYSETCVFLLFSVFQNPFPSLPPLSLLFLYFPFFLEFLPFTYPSWNGFSAKAGVYLCGLAW